MKQACSLYTNTAENLAAGYLPRRQTVIRPLKINFLRTKAFILKVLTGSLVIVVLFSCQKKSSEKPNTSWTAYTTADGLLSNRIVSIAIDAQGNKWFGTMDGVSEFDGKAWTNYTMAEGLAAPFITSICADNKGNIWAGTWNGISMFDGTIWKTFKTGHRISGIDLDSQGSLWFIDDVEVSEFDGTNWASYPYPNSEIRLFGGANVVAADAQDNKWFGLGMTYAIESGYGGIAKLSDSNWASYSETDGLVSNNVWAIAFDKAGNKWFGTGGGASKFDGTNWTTYKTADGLASNKVKAIAIDIDDNKWFGTLDKGVSKFDGTNWTTYNRTKGLICDTVYTINVDPKGYKWFGTDKGVSLYTGK